MKETLLCILSLLSAVICVIIITAISIVVGQHPDPDSCSFVLGFSNVHIYDVELEIIPAPVNKEMMHLPFV